MTLGPPGRFRIACWWPRPVGRPRRRFPPPATSRRSIKKRRVEKKTMVAEAVCALCQKTRETEEKVRGHDPVSREVKCGEGWGRGAGVVPPLSGPTRRRPRVRGAGGWKIQGAGGCGGAGGGGGVS